MDQSERRLYLIKYFLGERPEYRGMTIPDDEEGRRRLLRALMNVRFPAPVDSEALLIQDEYLRERSRENGIVDVSDVPVIRDGISLWQGDITRLAADAIVNAANSQMLGCFQPLHECIDNCIHTYAGVELRAECHRQMTELRAVHGEDYEQPTAVPMLTDGYNLPAKKVVHIVGPIVFGALSPEHEKALADCYKNTLELCAENGLRSVAFCCISTGVFRFPNRRAAEIAVAAVKEWLSRNEGKLRVIFNVFKDEDRRIYGSLI